MTQLVTLTKHMLKARRTAITRGELKHMWPGAAWDITTLWWYRGICRR